VAISAQQPEISVDELALRLDRRLGPVTAATAALMAADAWFDVCTSPAGRSLTVALLDMTVEVGIAATCLLLPRMAGRPGHSR
jgi:hypothetical protein